MKRENLTGLRIVFEINGLSEFFRDFMICDGTCRRVMEELVDVPGGGAETFVSPVERELDEISERLDAELGEDAERVGSEEVS